MLQIIRSINHLDLREITQIYEDAGFDSTPSGFKQLKSHDRQKVSNIYECFYDLFRLGGFCGLWIVDGRVVSAVRAECFEDGYLISGLVTRIEYRGNGYASNLLSGVVDAAGKKCYSHVDKRNKASLLVHRKCGFQHMSDFAYLLDGTVTTNAYTLVK